MGRMSSSRASQPPCSAEAPEVPGDRGLLQPAGTDAGEGRGAPSGPWGSESHTADAQNMSGGGGRDTRAAHAGEARTMAWRGEVGRGTALFLRRGRGKIPTPPARAAACATAVAFSTCIICTITGERTPLLALHL